jgi:hypothetical protein
MTAHAGGGPEPEPEVGQQTGTVEVAAIERQVRKEALSE